MLVLFQTLLERLKFVRHSLWELISEFFEPLFDHRDFGTPFFGDEFDGVLEILVGDIQAIQVESIGGWDNTNWGLNTFAFAFESLNDPFQHARVLAETRPREFALFVAAEPVDQENLR